MNSVEILDPVQPARAGGWKVDVSGTGGCRPNGSTGPMTSGICRSMIFGHL
ncbi:MAG: hypothetical protein ACD_54C00223G0003 [uncultured bacterium]|nr:MAG: hypothetical protein ACD_54C00223G0003 [uncultured bacterium]